MEFGQNIFREIDLFDFTRFFAWTFSNFLTCCVLKSETTTNERKNMKINYLSKNFCAEHKKNGLLIKLF